MNQSEFNTFIQNKIIYLDGATGSNLIKRGMPAGVCPEEWILEHPDIFIKLQREYVEAGSNIIYAPTFTSNRIKLAEYGLQDRIEEINTRLVELSKEASGKKALVAGDITMTGRQLAPMGTMDFEELVDIYKEQIRILVKAGVDLFIIETMMSLQETRAALIAAKEVCDLPVMATLTFEPGGRTLFGTDALTAAVTLEKLGACAIGANCSTGPDKMLSLIREMAKATKVPVIAKPNAGMPALNDMGETVYSMDADTFGREMKALVEAGASVLGGCCGTSPEYIKKLVEATKDMQPVSRNKNKLRYLCSERKTVSFDLNAPFMVVGERINPTGKKKLQAELRDGCLDMVLAFAKEQEECGAQLLDINVGMSGIDEKEIMLKVLEEVTVASSLPLVLDSSHVDVMEEALRRYPGRALINSISMETEKIEKLLPLAKKYGAMFILLPLSDKGLPENLEEKTAIIEAVSKRAFMLGMEKEDIIVDGLVTTVGANPMAAREVLDTVAYCKKNGFATICGLSNISFGLPERSFINTAFLTMAIKEGLTMAIANPSQDLLMNIAFASDLLMKKEEADIRYIERAQWYKERQAAAELCRVSAQENKAVSNAGKAQAFGELQEKQETAAKHENGAEAKHVLAAGNGKLYQDVLKGNRKQIKEHTKLAIEQGEVPEDILNLQLLPAINEVGELFDKGKYFLPQLIASAEAMKLSVEYLEPLLAKGQEQKEMPAVVVATVAGDIHDIGKNLVVLMLKNHGFKVIDLGKDVPKEVILEAAIEHQAGAIGLSALMTTTMKEMKNVIDYAKEKAPDVKIMIGGAVITEDYAKEIGAHGYAADAAGAVRVVKNMLGMESD